MENFLKFRYWILLISNLMGGLFCIYFISKANEYELKWNLLASIFPGITANLNTILQLTGTYILLIPLTIIILSLLIPENIGLRIVGSFFGCASTLLVIVSGFLRNNSLIHSYNMKNFLVQKLLSIEEKRVIFKGEFIRILDTFYIKYKELYTELQACLSENHFAIYDTKLITIKEASEIKSFAHFIIKELATEYDRNKLLVSTTSYAPYIKYVFWGVVIISVVVVGVVVVRYFTNSDDLMKGAELAYEHVKTSLATTQVLVETQKSTVEGITNITTEMQNHAAAISNLQITTELNNEQLANVLNTHNIQIQNLQQGLGILFKAILKLNGESVTQAL